jgi:hypothetical protein
MGDALLIGAAVAAFGAVVALSWLPSRPTEVTGDRREELQPVAVEGS